SPPLRGSAAPRPSESLALPREEKSWNHRGAQAIRVGPMVGGCVIASKPRLRFAGSVVVLNRRAWERSSASSVLALAIALPSKLRVAPAEPEHMPIYLRTFFRVMSSWVHGLDLRNFLAAV